MDLRRKIAQREAEVLDERARFLWALLAKRIGRIDAGRDGLYLDVGTAGSADAKVFRDMLHYEFAIGIDTNTKHLSCAPGLILLQADAHNLPFRDETFKVITMFSVIEHVRQPMICLSEASRVLRRDGQLLMQFPNRYFPIELHSGLPFYFYLPKRIRIWFAVKMGMSGMKDINIPSVRHLRKSLKTIQGMKFARCLVGGFHYPESFLPKSKILMFFYRLMELTHIFDIFPMGYVMVIGPNQKTE